MGSEATFVGGGLIGHTWRCARGVRWASRGGFVGRRGGREADDGGRPAGGAGARSEGERRRWSRANVANRNARVRASLRDDGGERARRFGRDAERRRAVDAASDRWLRDSPHGSADGQAFAYRRSPETMELTPLQEKLRSGHEFLYGIAPVLAALRAQRRAHFYELFVQESGEGGAGGSDTRRRDAKRAAARAIVRQAESIGLAVTAKAKGDLNTLCGNRPHQGFVLECDALATVPLLPLDEFDAQARAARKTAAADGAGARLHPCWLALDEIWDPQNLGALLRSAYFLGCDGVMLSSRNSAGLTATVSKASSGAMEVMPVYAVSNMPKFLQALHADKGWTTLGAAAPTAAEAAAKRRETSDSAEVGIVAPPVHRCSELHLNAPTILVLGNEGHGMRTTVMQSCSEYVSIECGLAEMRSADLSAVDSLNVSVAAGILLHRLLFGR